MGIIKTISNLLTTKSITPNINNIAQSDEMNLIDSYFSWFIGNTGAFGKYTKSYGENPLVYMVVNRIATTSASLPIKAVDSNGEVIDNSKLIEILKNPNDEDDEISFKTKINENLLLNGNCFIKITRGEGMGQSFEILHTKKVRIVCNSIGEIVRYEYNSFNGNTISYQPEEILHIKTSNVVNVEGTHSKYGLAPLQALWIVVTSSMEKLKADASIFKSRGIIGILTNDSDNVMLDPERKRLQKNFDDNTGGSDKYNKIHVSASKLKFLQTGMSPTDLKLLDGILSSLRLICGVYGISSILFNDNDSSTYNNVVEAKKGAYTDVYIPLADKINKELSRWLNEMLGLDEHIIVDKTSIDILKASTNETSQALNNVPTNVANRSVEAMTVNEVRENILGLNTVDNGNDLMGKGTMTNQNTTTNG